MFLLSHHYHAELQKFCIYGNPIVNRRVLGEYAFLRDKNSKPSYSIDNSLSPTCKAVSEYHYIYFETFNDLNTYVITDEINGNSIPIRLRCTDNINNSSLGDMNNPFECTEWEGSSNNGFISLPSIKMINDSCPEAECERIEFKWDDNSKNNVCNGIYTKENTLPNLYKLTSNESPTGFYYLYYNRKYSSWFCGDTLDEITGCADDDVLYWAEQKSNKTKVYMETDFIAGDIISMWDSTDGTGMVTLSCISPTTAPTKEPTDSPTKSPSVSPIGNGSVNDGSGLGAKKGSGDKDWILYVVIGASGLIILILIVILIRNGKKKHKENEQNMHDNLDLDDDAPDNEAKAVKIGDVASIVTSMGSNAENDDPDGKEMETKEDINMDNIDQFGSDDDVVVGIAVAADDPNTPGIIYIIY